MKELKPQDKWDLYLQLTDQLSNQLRNQLEDQLHLQLYTQLCYLLWNHFK